MGVTTDVVRTQQTEQATRGSVAPLREAAKELLRALRAGEARALARYAARLPDKGAQRPPCFADALHVIACEQGAASWPRLLDDAARAASEEAVRRAVEALAQGRAVVLFDAEDRENEGDLVVAAALATPASVNLLVSEGRGTFCLALSGEIADRLGLAPAYGAERTLERPAFLASIDAAVGVTTGVSAADRATTVRAAVAAQASSASFRSPGHVFPLREEKGGLAARRGHTEGAVELMRRAGLPDAAMITEVLRPDGEMARREELLALATRLALPYLTLDDLVRTAAGV